MNLPTKRQLSEISNIIRNSGCHTIYLHFYLFIRADKQFIGTSN